MAVKTNLLIEQGTTFSSSINITDDNGNIIDLTDYTSAAQIRKYYNANTYHTFVTEISVNDGAITLSVNAAASANITPGRYVYDCKITDPDGNVTRLVEGIVTVTPGVTR